MKIEIRQIENYIKRSKETIERLKSQENSDFNKKQIEKLKITEVENQNKLELLNKKYEDISSGKFDKEIIQRMEISANIIKEKQQIADKKVKDKNDRKKEDKIILDTAYKNGRTGNGLNKYQIEKETNKFFLTCSTIPDFMLDNLKDMPNNKGYIWRGIWCLGEKPKEDDDLVLFEKCKGGLLKIHEYTEHAYTLYEKMGKGQKKMIFKKYRTPILTRDQLNKIV